MLFSCLRDFYERLDESDIARVLAEVQRNKKDTFEMYNREVKPRHGMDSPSSMSSAPEEEDFQDG